MPFPSLRKWCGYGCIPIILFGKYLSVIAGGGSDRTKMKNSVSYQRVT